ncbi:LysR family transcriptional regulator for bpeEF and oprC [Paraburkholderia sp. BL6665CI2N2]|uniref:LysR family transcriptional regulator n=1 Tax=Paraburkholderia sp. BL6665CI2N2 TaxID=1938806 RepID=UPI0010D92249|nr:LysR family transcriptional regulator [Paraburkholderia sp. BL6665CI2N2]TDY22071.1 LysR family transcriptional regulator for bpeEF and oprC [Paraburkholderia sp. BL6665CI2N2]
MDRLQAMQTFIKVVEMNSFSRAADALQLPRASATTIIKNLEAHLKVSLMRRTTRRLNLTPEGAQYYELCVRILSEIQECEDAIANTGNGPRGQLRIDMPGSIGRLIVAPKIMEFRERYPDIDLIIGFVDKPVCTAQDDVDCAIRSGDMHDSSLIRRRLSEVPILTAASPKYVERHGKPTNLSDLQNHFTVHYHSDATSRAAALNFVVEQVPREVEMRRALMLSDIEAYVTCGVTGAGIIQAPRFLIQAHLDSGRLVEVLPQWKPLPISISALYPPNRHLTAKVRVFVEWIAAVFESCPTMRTSEVTAPSSFDISTFNDVASSL